MRSSKYMTILLLTALFLSGCALTGQSQTREETAANSGSRSGPEERNLNILTTNRHLAQMIQALSGGHHVVEYMAETEEQLINMAPDPAMVEAMKYRAFFYIGAGYEPFVRDFTGGLDKNRIYVVNVSRGINIRRHQVNKLDMENSYYLTNSTNYKIALNTLKNALTELDPARRTLYNEKFVELSRDIDALQGEIRNYMENYREVLFITDSDLVSYAGREYSRDLMSMTLFKERMTRQAGTGTGETPAKGSEPAKRDREESRIFLYSEDTSIQKYSEDIIRYGLLPVKVHLYDENITLMDSFYSLFREIRKAIETSSTASWLQKYAS